MSDKGTCALGTILVVGRPLADDPGGAGCLSCIATEVVTAEDPVSAEKQKLAVCPDLIVIREDSDRGGALPALQAMRACYPAAPAVVVTRAYNVESARSLTRGGALDYIEAPLEGDRLDRLLAASRRGRTLRDQAERYLCPYCPPGIAIVGRSEAISKTLETLHVVSASRCNPMLILGETGTGKELLARGVHVLRCMEQDPFVAVNCAALTASLLESELFGHVKGAFTGADRDRTGLFEAAGEGTLFLDEISEMPLELQAKLLRALQENTFRKVGDTKDIAGKATIVVSSNRDLHVEAAEGRFRKDLYYRLAIFPITVPPLRSPQRREDIPLLAEYFIRNSTVARAGKIKGLSAAARGRLLQHDWPGNVRELRNVIDRALIVEQTDTIQPANIFIESMQGSAFGGGGAASAGDFSLETAEREFILRALKETGWQRTRAAALLGISRATLHVKLKRFDIKPPGDKPSPARPLASPVS